VLDVHACHAGFVSGEEGRQLIRRDQEIHRGNYEQDDTEQRKNELHGRSPFEFDEILYVIPGREQSERTRTP
jgi:hypothetical protein